MNCLYLRPENYIGPAVLATDRKSCRDAAFPIDPRPERGLSDTFILLLDSTMHFLYSFVIGRHCPLAARLSGVLPLRSGTMTTGRDLTPAQADAHVTDPAHNRPIMQDQKTHPLPRPGLLSVFGKVEPLLWAALYLFLAYVIQFHIVAAPHDADTAYHAAVGSLIREHGILQSFPWTPFSWLSDHYADKELLFHLLFVPFIGLGWITASKLVGMLLGAVLLAVIYLILRAEGVRFAGVWALVPLITSDVFLFRFALVRPHLMSIALAFLLLWAALRGRLWLLFAVSALYPWSYVAFWQVPVILLAIVESARFLSGERIEWRPAAVAGAGIVIGWAVHPNSINLLKFNWIQMVDVLFKNAWQTAQGIDLGKEFLPFTIQQWGQYLLAGVAMVLAGLVVGWRERKRDPGALAFAFAALAFGLLTARTARFAEYFIPLAAATMALAARAIPRRGVVIAVVAVLLLYTAKPISETVQGLHGRTERMPPKLASWLQQRIPAGSQVFTTEWGHTGTLLLALPDRKFIVALDPTLFLVKDPALYRLWYEIPRFPRPGMAEVIRNRFSARFVISFLDERFSPFYFQLASEPGVRALLLSDEYWVVFDLGGPPS